MTTSEGCRLMDVWSGLLRGDVWGVWSRRITLEKRIVHFEAAVVINEAQPKQLMHRSLTWWCRSRWSRKPRCGSCEPHHARDRRAAIGITRRRMYATNVAMSRSTNVTTAELISLRIT